jgi:hypothetical protein
MPDGRCAKRDSVVAQPAQPGGCRASSLPGDTPHGGDVAAGRGRAGLAITADVYAKVTADSMRRPLAKLDKVLAGP